MLLLLYVAFGVPYRLGFTHPVILWSGWFWFDAFTDAYFVADIFVSFRTAFYNVHGELVVDSALVKRNYLQTWFPVDIAACLPFHYINFAFESEGDSSTRIIKLLRMLRLLKLVSGVDTVVYLVKALTTSGKSLLYMTSLIGFFVVLLATITMHVFGNCEGHGELLRNQSRTNFYTFGNSILANVQMLTGEDWAPVAFMHMDVCGWAAAPFFTAIIILYNFVLMNLFTAIILQNFSVSEHDKLRHQKESFRKDRGKQALEEDMAILECSLEVSRDCFQVQQMAHGRRRWGVKGHPSGDGVDARDTGEDGALHGEAMRPVPPCRR